MDIIMIIAILAIPAIAQLFVTVNYNKYTRIELNKKVNGFEVARKILDANGLEKVHIVETQGKLTDHYDPSKKVVRLSKDIFHRETISAASIAAHEAGHAIQDAKGYIYMRFRAAIFPVVRIATQFSFIIIILSFIFEMAELFYLGIATVALGLLFQLVTLPVEFNASKIAKDELIKLNLISPGEVKGASKVLGAAAMTYVAGVLATALQLLRFIMMFRGRR